MVPFKGGMNKQKRLASAVRAQNRSYHQKGKKRGHADQLMKIVLELEKITFDSVANWYSKWRDLLEELW